MVTDIKCRYLLTIPAVLLYCSSDNYFYLKGECTTNSLAEDSAVLIKKYEFELDVS